MAMVVSEVVGVGIFLAPAEMMRTLGSAWTALAVWTLMGALTALGALCYAELATRFPAAGGGYVFLREAFGPRVAFVYGWMSLLVVDPGLTAALGIGLAQYLLATWGGPPALTPIVAVASIVTFGLLTLLGVSASTRILRWSALAKLSIVAVLVGAAVLRAGTGPLDGSSPDGAGLPLTPEALAAAVVAAFFAFGGWWDLGKMSEEVKEPSRTMPAALLGGVGLVAVIYALVTVAFMLGPTVRGAASDEAFVSVVGATLFGPGAGRLLAAGVVVAVAGSLAAVLLGAPRVYLAMARDGLFPERLGRFDERRGASRGGTLIQVSLACLLALMGTFNEVLGFFVPSAVFFLGLSAAAVLVLPRPPRGNRVFRAPGHPLPIVLFLLLIAAVIVLFAVGQPRQTLLGATLVMLGLPVSWYILPSKGTGSQHAD
jgi:APA family basic amino acid/polyamine antiporter